MSHNSILITCGFSWCSSPAAGDDAGGGAAVAVGARCYQLVLLVLKDATRDAADDVDDTADDVTGRTGGTVISAFVTATSGDDDDDDDVTKNIIMSLTTEASD